MPDHGSWLSINEYSTIKNISVSTIRRRIKSGRVKHKFEDGKYYIFDTITEYSDDANSLGLKLKVRELEQKIKILEMENIDLKMLVNLYEKNQQKDKSQELPELPPI